VLAGGGGTHDPRPAADARAALGVVEAQQVHVLEVEAQTPLLAVDLERVRVLVRRGEARGLEARDSAAGERGEEEHGVVDRALALLLRARDRALLDEGARDASVDLRDLLAGDEAAHVDDVRVEVAVRAGAGGLLVEAPDERRVGPAPALEVR